MNPSATVDAKLLSRGDVESISDGSELRRLLHLHGLLLIRPFAGNDDELTDLARRFGDMEAVHPPQFAAPGYPHIRIQSNVPNLGVRGGGEYWHSDGPWSESPSSATLLHCLRAPSRGGETLFVDMRRALAELPEDLRRKVEELKGFYPCRDIYLRELHALRLDDPHKLAELRNLSHPLVRRHPVTGEATLYLNEMWLHHVEGLRRGASRRLLDSLYRAATAPGRVHTHRWQDGDLLVWDNVSMMHKARPAADRHPKITHRITIRGRRAGESGAARAD